MASFDERKQAYSTSLCAHLPKQNLHPSFFNTRSHSTSLTKASYYNVHEQRQLSLLEVSNLAQSGSLEKGVLVAENVNLDWCIILGVSLGIDSTFFVEHASNPQGGAPWEAVIGDWSEDRRKPAQNGQKSYMSAERTTSVGELRDGWHVDGVLKYERNEERQHIQSELVSIGFMHRPIAYSKSYGWTAGTRISYVLASPRLYLFLVDAPVTSRRLASINANRSKMHIRLPLGLNRGGLLLPQLIGDVENSLYRSLACFFSHPWHHHVLFSGVQDGRIKLHPETIFHLIASSTWVTNLRSLDHQIKCTGLEDIRRPSISINDTLHDQRAELLQIIQYVGLTLKWLPPSVRIELDGVKMDLPASKYIGYPDTVLKDVLNQASVLEKFLMDSFTLLISSISVFEAASIKEQAQQGHVIAWLAFIYVPLSFITSVFGMNIREINGSPISIWVPITALLILSMCTFGFVKLRRWQSSR